jgi:hypothetical protein
VIIHFKINLKSFFTKIISIKVAIHLSVELTWLLTITENATQFHIKIHSKNQRSIATGMLESLKKILEESFFQLNLICFLSFFKKNFCCAGVHCDIYKSSYSISYIVEFTPSILYPPHPHS